MRLNSHTTSTYGTHTCGLDRWSVERSVEKWWVAINCTMRTCVQLEDTYTTSRDVAMHIRGVSHVPKHEVVMWTWHVGIHTEPLPVVRIVSPCDGVDAHHRVPG